ncbi:MAG: RsmE family RNA methyltransferase [Gemmataceae bacterium]
MAERYYVNSPLTESPINLGGPEAHHLATVCRIRRGDQVYLFNGDGKQYLADIVDASRRSVSLEIVKAEQPQRELPFFLEVAAPLPKGDRATFLVEKLTELGVTRFVPLRTARSVVNPREAKLDKLQRTVIEASKQCGRNVLMQIEPVIDWTVYCSRSALPSQKLLAHPPDTGNQPNPDAKTGCQDVRSSLFSWSDRATDRRIVLAVGPEGGFTEEEVAQGHLAGWNHVGLGPRILRVETAALVLAAQVILLLAGKSD